jgi:hypothetical protein
MCALFQDRLADWTIGRNIRLDSTLFVYPPIIAKKQPGEDVPS